VESSTATATWMERVLHRWFNKVPTHREAHCVRDYLLDHLKIISVCVCVCVGAVREGVGELHRGATGCQLEGQMTWVILHRELPRFPDDNTVQINFIFPDGIQTVNLVNLFKVRVIADPTIGNRLIVCLRIKFGGNRSSDEAIGSFKKKILSIS